MKIAFLLGQFPAPSETFILNQITGLIDLGHTVDIYGVKPPIPAATLEAQLEEYGLSDRVHYYPDVPSSMLARIVSLLKLIAQYGPQEFTNILASLNGKKYGQLAYSLRLSHRIMPFLKTKPSYDIIHCHFGDNGLLGMKLRQLGVLSGKLCTTFHGRDISQLLRERGEAIYDELFAAGDLFLPISQFWQRRLEQLGCPPNQIKVHHMGIDRHLFDYRQRRIPPDADIKVVSVARLVEKKGIQYGVKAMIELHQRLPRVHYYVIGDGPEREAIAAEIAAAQADRFIHLMGWKTPDEVSRMLSAEAHIFLAPSVTSSAGDMEGIPVALMEAMSMGIPVVSTRHSGIPELIQDGVSGLLAAERDHRELAQKMGQLIDSPEQYATLANNAQQKVAAQFDVHPLNQQLVEHFEAVLTN